MNDANALTVKRDAYKLMNDMEEKRNKVILENSTNLIEFSKEMMMEKLMMMDEKMNSRYESVLEQQRLERNELFDMFAKLTESLASKTDVNIEVTKKVKTTETEEEYDDIDVEKPYKPVAKKKKKLLKRRKPKKYTATNDDIEEQFQNEEEDD